ncbi:MAG: hypothetical protein Q9205_003476 [Flavoplaca limonia]
MAHRSGALPLPTASSSHQSSNATAAAQSTAQSQAAAVAPVGSFMGLQHAEGPSHGGIDPFSFLATSSSSSDAWNTSTAAAVSSRGKPATPGPPTKPRNTAPAATAVSKNSPYSAISSSSGGARNTGAAAAAPSHGETLRAATGPSSNPSSTTPAPAAVSRDSPFLAAAGPSADAQNPRSTAVGEDAASYTRVEDLPEGNLSSSTYWPQYPYGLGSFPDDIRAAQSTIIFATLSNLRMRLDQELQGLERWKKEQLLREEKAYALYTAHEPKLGVADDIIEAARPTPYSKGPVSRVPSVTSSRKPKAATDLSTALPFIQLDDTEETLLIEATSVFVKAWPKSITKTRTARADDKSQKWQDRVVEQLEKPSSSDVPIEQRLALRDKLCKLSDADRTMTCIHFTLVVDPKGKKKKETSRLGNESGLELQANADPKTKRSSAGSKRADSFVVADGSDDAASDSDQAPPKRRRLVKGKEKDPERYPHDTSHEGDRRLSGPGHGASPLGTGSGRPLLVSDESPAEADHD